MSSCGVSGIGPRPDDPSNNSVLQANPAVGGIDLSWTFPTVNPFAVAHTKIYRSTSSNFINAIEIASWGGNNYFDRVAHGTQYWYWIRFISINGTENALIGPASATAMDSIGNTIERLTGLIDAGVLAIALRTQIDRIPVIGAQIQQEVADRLASNQALSTFLNSLDVDVDAVTTLIQNETTQRLDGDNSLLQNINTLAIGQGNNAALITEERNLRVSADSALSERVTLNYAQVQTDISAAVLNVTTAYTNADTAAATQSASLYATKSGLTAAVQDVTTARVNADDALSQRITTIEAGGTNGVDSVARAAIQDETTARINGDNAIGQRVTTVETANYGGAISQVQQNLTAYSNFNNGKVTEIGALYTLKLNVNGLIGGFGAYNDGTTVQVGFDVDSFWVGRTGANMRKPFIIQGDSVFMDKAYIYSLEVEKLLSGSVNAEWRMTGVNGRIVMDNGAVMKVIGTGFGTNFDLIEWFGPSMAINLCTKANATTYLGTNGSAYYGGTLSAGTLYNARKTTEIAADAQIPLGPYFSNGNLKTIVVSYTYDRRQIYLTPDQIGEYTYVSGTTTARIEIYKVFNNGVSTLVQSMDITGGYTLINEPDGPDFADTSMSGSLTFTDAGGTGNYIFTAKIVSRTTPYISHSGSGNFAQTQEAQVLSIVSTEQ